MKNKIKLVLHGPAILLTILLVSSGAVLAVNSPGSVSTYSPIVSPPDPQATTTIEQRIAQRKASLRVQQNAARAQSISNRCSLAQSAIGQLRTKDTRVRVQRNQIYTTLAGRLNNVVINLGNQGVNASDLHAKQKHFNDAINKYLATAMEYKTAVDDLVNMDCRSDTAGFEATLMVVRSLRTQLSQDAGAIKGQLTPLVNSLSDMKKTLSNQGDRN